MAETKLVTLDGLKKFKELLDSSYSEKFADKNQAVDEDGNPYASDKEVKNLLDDIFGTPSTANNEMDELLDNVFG